MQINMYINEQQVSEDEKFAMQVEESMRAQRELVRRRPPTVEQQLSELSAKLDKLIELLSREE